MLALALLFIPAFASPVNFRYVPQDGDVIFQTSRSRQSKAIQAVTGSRYSHMGIVFLRDGNPYVFEAVDPVKYTPLQDWIDKGVDRRYVVKRLQSTPLSADHVKALKAAGAKYAGKDYDAFFAWSDREIYCSELVWKMYKSAMGLEVGIIQRFKDFDLSHPVARSLIKERWGGKPPLNELVVSPASIFASPLLRTVYQH